MLVGVCLLTLGLVDARPATATLEAAATLDGYACGQVDPELFTRQKWSERDAPYGIAFPEWDRTTFEALKRRMLACATPANQRRTAMMLRYIDDQPYGRQAQVTQAVEALRARQAKRDDAATELRDAVSAAETDPDPANRRTRVTAIEQRLTRGGIPSALELELRARLGPLRSAIADQDARDAAATAAVQAQQRADAAKRAEDQRQLAQQQATARQAEAQRRQADTDREQVEADARAEAEQAAAEQVYAGKAADLSPPVRAFLDRNPQYKATSARADLLTVATVLDAAGFDLDTCRGALDDYRADWTEVQRRYGVVQGVLLAYHGLTAAELAAGAQARRQAWAKGGVTEGLRSNVLVMRRTCSQSLALTTALADFTR
ncbi:hypothetical protein FV242_22975 [Methylobacterium sp. WL64]|uniref:hypothetical protein n=1 Tax=Methylobacterium sp. WL64 TaxID=2603894 RepID=UPI0011CAD0AF|nr:hypothetical protein [Methylobacterium sp. WL64]TXN00160.1 hypothetical protein FV242_22975 [Methylobacterium sp. WL64]